MRLISISLATAQVGHFAFYTMAARARLGATLWRSKGFWAASAVGAAAAAATPMGFTNIPAPAPVFVVADAPRPEFDANDHLTLSAVSSRRDGLPTYTATEVQANNGKGDSRRVWTTYGDAVYDITDFLQSHPGGKRILLAAGGALEPYFEAFPQHKEEFVYELLDEMRIGNLEQSPAHGNTPRRSAKAKLMADGNLPAKSDPFANEPDRDSRLIVRSSRPFNAEPPPGLLVASQITPNGIFYVRNHLPVPTIDPEEYRLAVCDSNNASLATYSLRDLKENFKKHTVVATVQCAGNRRDEMSAVKAVKGGSWEIGAVSNASWSGVRLRDVLSASGLQLSDIKDEKPSTGLVNHIVFEGLDQDAVTAEKYEGSIPLDIFLKEPDILLAYEMNGERLPPDHGYPLRLIVPGVVGARSVKWLGKISLAAEESSSHWQRNDYKSFCPSVDWDTVDFGSAPAIQELPVQSAICTAVQHAQNSNIARVEGYAWSGDGKDIIRVDVSADGGNSWSSAELLPRESDTTGKQGRNRVYEWTRWTADLKCPDTGSCSIVCKAVDSAYNTQPERVESIWNIRGVVNNAWHKVDLGAIEGTNGRK